MTVHKFKQGEDPIIRVMLNKNITGETVRATLRRLDGVEVADAIVHVDDASKGEVRLQFPRTLPLGRYFTDVVYTQGAFRYNIEDYIFIQICQAATIEP